MYRISRKVETTFSCTRWELSFGGKQPFEKAKSVISYSLLILGFTFFFFLSCTGQIDIRRISVEEGLSSRRVWSLDLDNRGFLWAVTDNGINRYDGQEFVQFGHQSNHAFFPMDQIWRRCFWVEEESILLITPKSTPLFEAFDPYNGTAKTIRLIPLSGQQGRYSGIVKEVDGRPVFLTQDSALCRFYEYRQGRFLLLDTIASPAPVMDYFWSNTLVLLNTEQGVSVLNRKDRSLKTFELSSLPVKDLPSAAQPPLRVKVFAGQARIAFDDIPGWYGYDLKSRSFYRESGNDNRVYRYAATDHYGNEMRIFQDRLHEKLVFVELLICEYGQEETYLARIDDKIHFSGIRGTRFSEHVWLPTNNGILQLKTRKVKTFLDSNAESNKVYSITSLNEDSLLITTGRKRWFVFDLRTDEAHPLQSFPDTNAYPGATDLVIGSRGRLWGIYKGKLLEGNLQQGFIREALPPRPVTAIALDGSGKIWVAAYAHHEGPALYHYEPETKEFNRWPGAKGVNLLGGSYPNCLHFCKNGGLWATTDEGLLAIDTVKNDVRRYPGPWAGQRQEAPAPVSFTAIRETPEGHFWLGTSHAGLLWFDPSAQRWKQWTVREGLCDNYICSILPDEAGNLWLSTLNGVSYFDVEEEIFHNFHDQDGLSQNTFSLFAAYRTPEGRIFFGGANGMDAFYAGDLLALNVPTQLEITRLLHYKPRQAGLSTSLFYKPDAGPVVLPARHRYLEVHVALPHFSDPGKGQFAYFLEGFHEDWQQNGREHIITFHYLPAGRYQLHLKGALRSGKWSETVTLDIVVRNFFYTAWWFYALCLLGILLIMYLLQKFRARHALHLENLRMDIASDVHDEVGNNLVHLHQLLKDVESASGKEGKNELRRAQSVLKRSLESIRDLVWAIDARNDATDDLVGRMDDFLFRAAKPLGIQYSFSTENINYEVSLNSFIRQHVYLIFKEAISNVVKHSEASRVEVTVRMHRDWNWKLGLIVQDNGKGIADLQAASHGNGLASMYRRAEKLNGRLNIESQPGKGVRIELACTIPRK